MYIPLADVPPLDYGLAWSAVDVAPMGREFARLAIKKYAMRSSDAEG
ncbi:hypothetical protein [Nocardia cyriacigeorgica]|nr:hypothetical protein [Nocardia cyriacigeorgica]